jgi:serine protease
VATTAGVAALWLARHGRDQLIQRYGAEKIPILFNHMLRSTCTPVPGWDPNQFGVGLVNAEQLLAAPLPDPALQPLAAPSFFLDDHPPIDRGGEATFTHLFESTLQTLAPASAGLDFDLAQLPAPGSVLRARLAQLLNINEAEVGHRLNEVGQELAFHLITNPDLYKQFASSLTARSEPSAPEPQAIRGTRAPRANRRSGTADAALLDTSRIPIPAVDTAVVRETLLNKDTSAALRSRLSQA